MSHSKTDARAALHIGQADGSKFEMDRAALTKHAIILGATGSGKTVLSKVIVEEAALQGIPTFAIDPKGDIGNLAFKSPSFDFARWSGKEADALKTDRQSYAADLKKTYGEKAREFGVRPGSASDFAKVKVRIFTPKSSAGLAVGISPDLSVPKNFERLLSSDIASAADLLDLTSYNLLRLAGFGEGDRKEITFVSAILENAWKAGRSLTIQDLIRSIVNPPFASVGSMHVSDVISEKERRGLATKINLLVSDPKLRSWSAAEPLNFTQLFSEPSVNILDLRNIQSEQEKRLFVELVLQQLFQWLIKQGSAQTLRYLLYFDEIAGYCPPVREPPSKKLLLLLIKQARAFGLGLLLASQNAVDLDYKVISNANVRFIGRLGAQRDIQRVSVGLELGSYAEREVARLKAGEFFCNVFDPKFRSVIKSRWPLTYHRGPLENSEIAELMAEYKDSGEYERMAAGDSSSNSSGIDKEDLDDGLEAGRLRQDRDLAAAGETQTAAAAEATMEEEKEGFRPGILASSASATTYSSSSNNNNSAGESFLLLDRKFEPKNLASFMRLGSNLKSVKVLSYEIEERLHPVFELSASVFEKSYAKQSLDKVIELAAFDDGDGSRLVEIPPEHSITSQRPVPPKVRREAELQRGEVEKRIAVMKELQDKFDILIEEKRKENIESRCEKPRAKMADIDADMARLQEAINADLDAVKGYEKLHKEIKKEAKKDKKKKGAKARLISLENRIEAKKQKVLSTRRKIEQLHTNRQALEEQVREIELDEKDRFHRALAGIKGKASFEVAGWLVETVYRAKVVINGSKEHYGDVRWSAYTGKGTWGRCSSCSVPLAEGSACNCGSLLCHAHLAYCKLCLEPACNDHRSLCHICISVFCARHSIRCELCRSFACADHSGACSVCNRKVCSDCSQKKGLIKRELVCRSCSSLAAGNSGR